MLKLFFYNNESRDSQIAYKALMNAGVEFQPFEVTGRNVANRLKRVGITHVPTLFIKDSRNSRMLVGPEIVQFLENADESSEDVPVQHKARQTYAPRRKARDEPEPESDSDVGSDEVSTIDVGSAIDSDSEIKSSPLEDEKGKISAEAAMKMMQRQQDAINNA